MTYERSYTDCTRPALGCGSPLQPFDIKEIYRIFPTIEQALAEARKAGLVSLYRLHKHCSAAQVSRLPCSRSLPWIDKPSPAMEQGEIPEPHVTSPESSSNAGGLYEPADH